MVRPPRDREKEGKERMRRQCEAEGCPRRVQGTNRVCARHLGTHDPKPAHHVAKERACIRGCGATFESTWAGDRVCGVCRRAEYEAERQTRRRGTHYDHYDSPFEPDGVPGIAS